MGEEIENKTKQTAAASRILNVAKELFYNEGIQAVGIDRIIKESSVAMNTMYKHFPSKDKLIESYLKARDVEWMEWLNQYIEKEKEPRDKILAIFNALEDWFQEETFRGCGFINASGELGNTKPYVKEISKTHKENVYQVILQILSETKIKQVERLAKQIMILVEGAIVQAYINNDTKAASNAKEIAEILLERE